MAATFASPTIRSLIRQRLAHLAGLATAVLGLALAVALATYNPQDPSLNTATARPVSNMLGPPGAMAADLLIQYFGIASGVTVAALLAWAYRTATDRPLRLAARLVCLLLALPALACLLAALPLPAELARFGAPAAGPGGAIGRILATSASSAGTALVGPLGPLAALGATALLALVFTWFTLGLTAREWRAASSGTVAAARTSARFVTARRSPGPPPEYEPEPEPRHALSLGALASAAGGWLAAAFSRRRARREDEAHDEPTLRPSGPLARAVAREAEATSPPRPARPPAEAPGESTGESTGESPAVAFDDEDAPTLAAPPPPAATRNRTLPRRPTIPGQASLPLVENGWQYPPLNLLKPAPRRADSGPSEEALQANARLLESVLSDYGVQGAIREIRPGPVVTLYELEPAPGIRSARVIGLADDVARSLSVTAVRIATVPGRNVIGIEVPNATRETVFLSELLGSEDWRGHPGKLALALGKDIGGTPVIADLARMPHLLIAGTTGSGKSVGINAMILSILYRLSPDQCRLIMIDPKMLELSVYEGIPHLLAPVVTEPAKAVTALKWTTREMERRYRAMSQLGVRNVQGYNDRVTDALSRGEVVTRRVQTGFDSETGKPVFEEQPLALKPLPYIVVVIDEMADLMMVAGKEVEAAVQRLAQMARAAGIHVIMATQRPSVDVITGTIKANFPTRISFQVISKFDSRTILGEQGAEQLLGQGDLLHMVGGGRIARVHGPFVADREVEDIVQFLRNQAEPAYDEEVTEGDADEGANPALSGIAGASEGEKGLFDQAVAIVAREGKASTSFIQRHLSIGYNRAAKLMDQLEREGIVSAANHVGKREVLTRVTRDDD